MDRNLLANATSQDDSPTPGYMLNDIARATNAAYTINTQTQDYLLSRLAKNNHNIKFKCLVIIKHICRTGRPEFKREMALKTDAIKECLQYKGPPDPLRGDEIYKRVREAARETLDAIFDGQQPVTTSAVMQANRIQGLGNDYVPTDTAKQSSGSGYMSNLVASVQNSIMGDGTDSKYAGHPGATGSFAPPVPSGSGYGGAGTPYNHGGSSSSSSSSGMQGMGNPNFKDSREDKTWVQRATEMAKASPTIAAVSGMYNGTGSNSNSSGNFGGSSGKSDYNFATNRGSNAYNSSQQSYAPQQPGNAFGRKPDQFTGTSSFTGGMVPDMPYGQPGTGRAGAAASDGKYEQSLIETLCEPGGLKPVPSEDKLNSFLVASATLSADIVGSCLLDVLNSESWQSRVKALIVIAHLVKVRENAETHAQWWAEHLEDLKGLLGDSKATVRTQAAKTIRVVNKDAAVDSSAASTANSSHNSPAPSHGVSSSGGAKEMSLLDSYDEVPAVPYQQQQFSQPYAPAPPSFAPQSDDSNGLFAGMSLGGAEQLTAPPPVPAPVPAPVAAVASSSIANHFDFLDDMSAPLPPAPPAPSASVQNTAAPVWNAPQAPPPVPVAAPVASSDLDIFGNMSLMGAAPTNHAPQQSAQQPAAPAAAGNYSSDLSGLNMTYSTIGINGMSNGLGRPAGHYGQQPQPPFNQFAPQNGQQNFQQQQQQQQQPQFQQQQQQYGQQPTYRPVAGNVIAPGMLSAMAPRKNIPTADSANGSGPGGNSGFAFLGGAGGPISSPGKSRKPAPQQNDSFSFLVSDTISSMNAKK